MRIYKILFALLFSVLHSSVFGQIESGITLKFRDQVTPLKITGVFVLPEEELAIEALYEGSEKLEIKSTEGSIIQKEENNWIWKAPSEKGIYPVTIIGSSGIDTLTLNCMVVVPFQELKSSYLGKFRVGSYPKSSNPLYQLPIGFIEVTKDNEMTKVSPHYRLKDFLCKQSGSYPKYVVLKERGIIKLETVQSYLNSQGIKFDRFSFISGYRTPYYNKSIGNVANSRHIFGDAYDVYIDADKDGRMDDLNNDGKVNKIDVQFLYNKIDKLNGLPWFKPFIGGLGLYGPNSRRTGFIHMDTRGYRARWGS